MDEVELSPNWDSLLGIIICENCKRQWPCHLDPWLYGSQWCNVCHKESLTWTPKEESET